MPEASEAAGSTKGNGIPTIHLEDNLDLCGRFLGGQGRSSFEGPDGRHACGTAGVGHRGKEHSVWGG
ncbi:MAG: hypothetical protein CMO06_21485 [Thalassospira sp.]|nr:hypothetical protein [Thalassospira sp.]